MTTKTKESKYIEAVGRRKTSVARVRITEATKTTFRINDKSLEEFTPVKEFQNTILEALNQEGVVGKYSVTVKISGGGMSSQAEAIRLGISRALVKDDKEVRSTLKKAGFLKRDGRIKERRKFGLKKARKAPQWSKR